MSSTSKPQKGLMAGCAHGWKPDKGKCPPKEVAKEFARADAAKAKKKGKK